MKLRFHPAPGALVRVPGSVPVVGVPADYVGRRFDAGARAYPAVSEPFEVDAESTVARRLLKLAKRDGSLLPADAETASAVGVVFVPHELVDGEFRPVAPKRKAD